MTLLPVHVPGPVAVLVGVDSSPGSEIALRWATEYADLGGCRLVVVHVVGSPVLSDGNAGLVASDEGLLAAGRMVSDRAVAAAVQHRPGVAVSALTLTGDPRAVLLDLARDASALVVGSRGRGPVASLLLGSVSVALASHAPCPLVVVRAQSDAVAAVDLSVVVGVDADGDATEALTLGFELAAARYRPLQVVHALGAPALFPYPDVVDTGAVARSREEAEAFLDRTLKAFVDRFPDVVVQRRLVQETPTQALVAASRTASTVVVGRRERGTVRSHLIGSVSRAVVEQAHSTVVVVRGSRS